jgi:hypothetical protein
MLCVAQTVEVKTAPAPNFATNAQRRCRWRALHAEPKIALTPNFAMNVQRR